MTQANLSKLRTMLIHDLTNNVFDDEVVQSLATHVVDEVDLPNVDDSRQSEYYDIIHGSDEDDEDDMDDGA